MTPVWSHGREQMIDLKDYRFALDAPRLPGWTLTQRRRSFKIFGETVEKVEVTGMRTADGRTFTMSSSRGDVRGVALLAACHICDLETAEWGKRYSAAALLLLGEALGLPISRADAEREMDRVKNLYRPWMCPKCGQANLDATLPVPCRTCVEMEADRVRQERFAQRNRARRQKVRQ